MSRVKGWQRGRGNSQNDWRNRRVAVKDERPRILIVCEGLKTEPGYFKGFKLANVNLQVVPAGMIHISVVEHTKKILTEDSDYEEVWCVFDRDKHDVNPKDLNLFNTALAEAKKYKIKVAYSNDAFELWYLLHFNYYDTAMSRQDYIHKLNDLIDGGYRKNDPTMFEKLESRMPIAIRNAKKLYDLSDKNNPGNADPSTTIFKLVKRLRELG
ncbi:MAG TPA: RloB family protein [Candidatus Saccharimonadales bacterium]|nr:RloB family protein [Candidatus Saccharimonadales bacterium]